MFIHRSHLSPPLRAPLLMMMWFILQTLTMCTSSQETADLKQSVCSRITVSLKGAADDFLDITDLNRRLDEYKRDQGWNPAHSGTQNEILEGVCNLLALRDLAEHVQGSNAVDMSSLLAQNVQDACSWLYSTSTPDIAQCEISLRYYCFMKTHAKISNSILVRDC